MKNEKISECISLINDKHLEEAACYVKDVYFHKNTEKNNKEMFNTKKSKVAAVICIAAVIAIISTVVVCVTAKRSVNGPPSVEDELVSGYVNSYVPTEKDYIRTDIHDEINKRKEKLCQEMIANGKDSKEAYYDSDSQIEYERALESVDILKKYNKLNNEFTLINGHSLSTVAWAACDLINSSGDMNIRDKVFLEMFLIYNYEYFGADEGLREEIDQTVPQGYKRNTYYRRNSEQNPESTDEEVSR